MTWIYCNNERAVPVATERDCVDRCRLSCASCCNVCGASHSLRGPATKATSRAGFSALGGWESESTRWAGVRSAAARGLPRKPGQ